ncbi:MAG: hypothetical protein K6F27_01110 [Ruminococcus sp.]|jgi:hypothetical protein|nr:hypothetical protein [Ruminococcus sp.]
MKKVISAILGVLFVILVVIGIVVATYVFSSPSKDGDSRQLIMGNWVDHDKHVKFTFTEDGDFKMVDTESNKTLGKGYFKVKEDNKEIKILLLHGDRSDDINFGISLFYFCTISYSNLKYPTDNEIKTNTKKLATATFLFQNADGNVYKCERDENKANFYGKEISTSDV